ncbi:MAG: hypothetical protein ACE37H_11050 [Phycisphaeraceae bacterium]
MDQVAAFRLLNERITALRQTPYAEISTQVGKTVSNQIAGEDSIQYRIDL